MKGSLSSLNVSDLIVDLYFTRRTGILRLNQGDIRKSIYFKDGSVVFAHSNLKQERLGEVLLRLGKITEDEFNSVAKELEEGKRLGKVLYERGFLSQSEITTGVGYQLQQIIYSVFNWDHGDFEFVDRDRPVFEDIMVDVSTPNIVIDGIRNMVNMAVIERSIGKDETRVVTRDSVNTRKLPRTNLDFSEETILSCLDGKSSIGKLRGLTHLSPTEFGRAMYMLLLSGMVGLKKAPAEDADQQLREEVHQRWTSFTTQPAPPAIPENLERTQGGRLKTLSEPELRRLIVETEKQFRDATDEEVLRVLPNATREEIQSAYDRLTEIFHPPYYSYDRYRDLKDTLKVIIDRLSEAYHNSLDKVGYLKPLGEVALPVVPKEDKLRTVPMNPDTKAPEIPPPPPPVVAAPPPKPPDPQPSPPPPPQTEPIAVIPPASDKPSKIGRAHV